MRGPRLPGRLFIWSVATIGLILVSWGANAFPPLNTAELVTLVVLTLGVAITSRFPIFSYRGTQQNVSTAAIFSLVLLYPTPAAVVAVAIGKALGRLLLGGQLSRTFASIGQSAIYVTAGGLLYRTLLGDATLLGSTTAWVAASVAATAMTVLNGLIVATGSALQSGPRAYGQWVARRRTDPVEFPGTYLLGALTAATVAVSPWLLAISGLLLVQLYRSMHQSRQLMMTEDLNRQLRRSLELDETLQTVAEYAARQLESTDSLLYLLDETRTRASLAARFGANVEDLPDEVLTWGDGSLVWQAIGAGRPIDIPAGRDRSGRDILGDDFSWGLAVPLVAHDGPLAVVVALSRQRSNVLGSSQGRAARLADHVTPAISHALSYRQAVEQGRFLAALAEYSRRWLTENDTGEVAEAAKRAAASLLGAEARIIWGDISDQGLAQPDDRTLVVGLSTRHDGPAALELRFPSPPPPAVDSRAELLGRQAAVAIDRLLSERSSLAELADLGRLAGSDRPLTAIAEQALAQIASSLPGASLALVAASADGRWWEVLAEVDASNLVSLPALRTLPRPSEIVGRADLHPVPLPGGGTGLLLPLASESETHGALLATGVERRTGRAALLAAYAPSLTLVLGNAKLAMLRESSAIATERSRVAAELHDGLTQTVTGAKLAAEFIRDFIETRPDAANEKIDWLCRQLNKAVQESRDSLAALQPALPDHGGLRGNLIDLAEAYADTGRLTIQPPIWSVESKLDQKLETAAYRIVREAVVNASKHAAGSAVEIRVIEEDGWLSVVVRDNGPGFEPVSVSVDGHLGMSLLRQRASEAGGRLVVTTAPGNGTEIRAELPLAAGNVSERRTA